MFGRLLRNLDLNFLGTALVIAAIGCMLIYSATYFADPSLNLLHRQIVWLSIAIVLMLVFLFIDYHVLFDVAPFLYGIGIFLLTYLLVWGHAVRHHKSWIIIGGLQFQPSEFMKVFTALLLAKFFDSNDRAYLDLRSFVIAAGIVLAPMALILLQPDFGTAITFTPLLFVAMFLGGIRWKAWVAIILVGLMLLPLAWFFFLKPYQRERVAVYLNPERDPRGSGFQVMQAKIAIGSGGIHGKGFKQGTQAKYGYLPVSHTDFIFSVLGEEWGFIGVVIVLGLYLFLIVQALTIAKNARDRGGTFLAVCLICFFIFHVLINVSMQIGVLPTTGIPLPLISYGGSQAMMFMIAIGLILNVDMRRFVNT